MDLQKLIPEHFVSSPKVPQIFANVSDVSARVLPKPVLKIPPVLVGAKLREGFYIETICQEL